MLSRIKTDTAIQLVNNIPLLATTINNRSSPFLLCREVINPRHIIITEPEEAHVLVA